MPPKRLETYDLTDAEREAVKAAAKESHLSTSQWISRAIRIALVKGKPL